MTQDENKTQGAISTACSDADIRELLAKADAMMALFRDAVELGYSITFSPEQLRALIVICEQGYLHKRRND